MEEKETRKNSKTSKANKEKVINKNVNKEKEIKQKEKINEKVSNKPKKKQDILKEKDYKKRELGILREKLEICLQKQKKEYEIQEFSDGNRLLEELKHQIPQIIFLDIEMPDISGMELAEQIFSSHINTNIIFVTNSRFSSSQINI